MTLRARSRLGKYRIVSRLGSGGYADVYKAYDTIEGIHVALKVPNDESATGKWLELFRKEIKLVGRLVHPNILPIKNADTIDGRLVVASPLGAETLGDRLGRRIAVSTAVEYAEQILDALAYAHARRVMHCDVKPDNFIILPEGRLCLADFGISRVAMRTVRASGSGTLGYMAPEQAMGRPSFRSDVFAAALILYRLFSGHLPEWPFTWPPPGIDRLQRSLPRTVLPVLRKGLHVDAAKRHPTAVQMRDAFRAQRPTIDAKLARTKSSRGGRATRRRAR